MNYSWLAIFRRIAADGQVALGPGKFPLLESHIKIIDVFVTLDWSSSVDPFGFVNGGVLTISSKIILRCAVDDMLNILIGQNMLSGGVLWDYEVGKDLAKSCLLVPVGTFDCKAWVKELSGPEPCRLGSLILKPTGNKNGQYERLGSFEARHTTKSAVDNLLQDLFEKMKGSKEAAWVPTEADYLSVDVDDEGSKWYTITIIWFVQLHYNNKSAERIHSTFELLKPF